MAFKHYDVVRAASSLDLSKRLTQKLKEGWQPFGSPIISTAGYGEEFIQAIAAEGDVTTPVVVTPEEGGAVVSDPTREPEYYYVLVT
ncbi:DUF1737 domain-containing protein, partial [Escherichia coli]|nr:DUF1737 domain-containing protein [Escherichia coli]